MMSRDFLDNFLESAGFKRFDEQFDALRAEQIKPHLSAFIVQAKASFGDPSKASTELIAQFYRSAFPSNEVYPGYGIAHLFDTKTMTDEQFEIIRLYDLEGLATHHYERVCAQDIALLAGKRWDGLHKLLIDKPRDEKFCAAVEAFYLVNDHKTLESIIVRGSRRYRAEDKEAQICNQYLQTLGLERCLEACCRNDKIHGYLKHLFGSQALLDAVDVPASTKVRWLEDDFGL